MATIMVRARHQLVLAGVTAILRAADHVVIESSAGGLKDEVQRYEADLILFDEESMRILGTEAVQEMRVQIPRLRFIVLAAGLESTKPEELVQFDADAVLLSTASPAKLLSCVDAVHHGSAWLDPELLPLIAMSPSRRASAEGLTPREHEIIELVRRGLRNKEIARRAGLTEGTVKMHLHHIFEKLQVSSRTQLVIYERAKSLVGILKSQGANDSDAASRAALAGSELRPFRSAQGQLAGV